jgi:hypothetical protein
LIDSSLDPEEPSQDLGDGWSVDGEYRGAYEASAG